MWINDPVVEFVNDPNEFDTHSIGQYVGGCSLDAFVSAAILGNLNCKEGRN